MAIPSEGLRDSSVIVRTDGKFSEGLAQPSKPFPEQKHFNHYFWGIKIIKKGNLIRGSLF